MNLPVGNTPHRVAVAVAARDGKIRRRAVEIYGAAARDWAQAPGVIARSFRGARELRSVERRFVGEAVYGMIRWRRRLGFAIGSEHATPLALYLVWLAGEFPGDGQVETELRVAGIDPARVGDVEARLAASGDENERQATAQSYPTRLVARLVAERGRDDAEKLLAAMNRRAPLTARANRLKNTRDELALILADDGVPTQPSPLAPDGLELLTHVNAYGLQSFKEGRFELQDAGSQAIAELTAPPPRGVVVDACAGAGGKTLALGALLGNRGRLTAFDVSDGKLEELRTRARRAGLTNVRAVAVDEKLAGSDELALHGHADRVLCDVPCSGLGTLRRNPEARWRLQPSDLDELPPLQRALLERYAPLVAVGGRLIYATCTVDAAENDAVVDAFLAAHPEFVSVPAKEILGKARAEQLGDGVRLRLTPHQHDTDGFFAAVLRRTS
ncbi:MAG: RsmB/NOP family class I SAM-dependent RNA methyltransferase [Polyangia bacterium]